MDEFYARASLVKLKMDRLHHDAVHAHDRGDLARLEAIEDEAKLLYENLVAIREEQLISLLPKPKRVPWWKRLLRRAR